MRPNGLSLVASLFTPVRIHRERALQISSNLAALTHAMSSIEHLFNGQNRTKGGINYWEITRDATRFRNPTWKKVLDIVSDPYVTNIIHAGRLAVCVGACHPKLSSRSRGIADAILAGTSYILAPRHHFGGDGSDQLAFAVSSSTALARLSSSPKVADAALWGLSLQAGLAYSVAGWVKLAGPKWRDGSALRGVMRTRVYGSDWLWSLLKRYPTLDAFLLRSTLIIECFFPIIFIARGRLTKISILAAGGMHAGIAVTMALGRFFPAFCALYPAVSYTTCPQHLLRGERRSDVVPILFLTGGLMLWGILMFDALQRQRRLSIAESSQSYITLEDGRRISISKTDTGSNSQKPLAILVHGLASPSSLWARVKSELEIKENYTVMTYNRDITRYDEDSLGVENQVDDLISLVRALETHQDIVLVGHSLGGLIVQRAAATLGPLISKAVLIDPTHPQQLEVSQIQQETGKNMLSSMYVTSLTLKAGLGRLMKTPAWIRDVPPESRQIVLDQVRDHHLWTSALKEWAATEKDFVTNPVPPEVTVPVLVITAGATETADPEMTELHQDYANRSIRGRHTVVGDYTHEGIILNKSAAKQIAHLIAHTEGSEL